ncbi:hypothetical protein BDV59DRAFT_201983 [Aspergillus ambiguus]|uniref:uncharacterized protein n=1 Tax=Aspergillus ambiguus TaxID=176160 RepID=UPI003CCD1064
MASTNVSHGMIDPQILGSAPSVTTPDHIQCKLNVGEFVKDFLDREQKSALYQSDLENRISEECARHQQERRYRSQAEQRLSEWQLSHFQLESAYRWSNEDNEILRRDLTIESKKRQDLEARLASSNSLNEALQLSASSVGNMDGRLSQEKSVQYCQLLLENQRQQDLITELQMLNRSQETTINTLQTTLQNLLGSLSCCSSYSESDGSSTLLEIPVGMANLPSQKDSECPQPRSSPGGGLFEE